MTSTVCPDLHVTNPDGFPEADSFASRRRARRHDATVVAIARTTYRRCPRSWLRGADRQTAKRRLERDVRRGALARCRWARWCGWTLGRCARQLGVDVQTLIEWQRRHHDRDDRLASKPLGARPLLATPAQRRDVLDFLALHGADLSLATLQDHFPRLARRDLGCLRQLARCEADRVAAGGYYRAVTWFGSGRAWALDHTEPPAPIDGRYRFVLTVRDLASGCTLAATAVAAADAASTIDVLIALFVQHGPPLVLKADNGGAFTADDTREFLAAHGVVLLLSPPRTPRYNGACEAGNGTIKHLAHRIACRHGRPERWSLDDLEAARLLANRRLTDRAQPLTPEQRFDLRAPIGDGERRRFAAAVAAAAARHAAELGVESPNPPRTVAADALARRAIAGALSDTGVVTIRSRRVRLRNQLIEAR